MALEISPRKELTAMTLGEDYAFELNIAKELRTKTVNSYTYKIYNSSDLDAAQRYLNKYYELGGSLKSRLQSVKYAHPMSSISGMKRIAFRQSLTPAQEATLQRALEWYNKTYKGG